jgi:O-antigen ligase
MYKDSLSLLKNAPLIGIGAGQWQALHATAADSTLAGVSIEYAHSDIIQTLVELGVLGMVPLVGLAFVVVRMLPQIRRETDNSRRHLLAGLATGLIAGVICAAFDFPLRLPAVSYLFVAVLSLLAVALTDRKGRV